MTTSYHRPIQGYRDLLATERRDGLLAELREEHRYRPDLVGLGFPLALAAIIGGPDVCRPAFARAGEALGKARRLYGQRVSEHRLLTAAAMHHVGCILECAGIDVAPSPMAPWLPLFFKDRLRTGEVIAPTLCAIELGDRAMVRKLLAAPLPRALERHPPFTPELREVLLALAADVAAGRERATVAAAWPRLLADFPVPTRPCSLGAVELVLLARLLYRLRGLPTARVLEDLHAHARAEAHAGR